MSELYLVRHGQASLGEDNYDQLSEMGFAQSHALGDYIAQRQLQFDYLLTGTMQRHRQTLDALVSRCHLSAVDRAEHAGLNEYDFHSICALFGEHKPDDPQLLAARENPRDTKLFYRLLRKALLAWSNGELAGAPESYAGFVARVSAAAEDIRKQAGRGARVLAVSSGGAISQFIGTILQLAPDKIIELNLQARNTGLTQFFFNENKYNLLQFNGVAHLDDPKKSELVSF